MLMCLLISGKIEKLNICLTSLLKDNTFTLFTNSRQDIDLSAFEIFRLTLIIRQRVSKPLFHKTSTNLLFEKCCVQRGRVSFCERVTADVHKGV